jgi:LCP family protein required for cell wall assembly
MTFLPRTRGGALWRFAAAAVLVVAFSAATTAVAGLLKVKDILHYINAQPALKHLQVTLPPPGAPETLLLIGSDHRVNGSSGPAHTDTMMLVRINDNSQTINVLSVPRDLKVLLPEGGVMVPDKLNAAFSIGGANLLLKTLKQQVFPGLQVNHVLIATFRGFAQLIDAIGCVYADVDHRYYNNTALTGYSSIDIQPGYQKLCGGNNQPNGALAFVRFRHTDTDIVRNARQQDFIRWAKQNFSQGKLLSEQSRLEAIFGKNVQSDSFLHSTDGIIELFDLIVNADKLTLKSVPFPAVLGPSFVTATPQQEEAAYRKFMTPTVAKPSSGSSGGSSSGPGAGAGHRHGAGVSSGAAPTAGLTADPGDGKSQSAQLGHVPFPVYYPKMILAGSNYCFAITADCDNGQEPQYEYAHSYPRKYVIHGPGHAVYPSYVFTLVVNSLFGQYYTVQGTTWKHPPILRSPTKVQVVGGKKLYEYYNGGRLSLVAFHTPRAVYWISNGLADNIGDKQMIGMAASLTPAS